MTKERYSYVATVEEIEDNEYNLNIPRYVDTFEEEDIIDLDEVQDKIKKLEQELQTVQIEMQGYLKKLGYEGI